MSYISLKVSAATRIFYNISVVQVIEEVTIRYIEASYTSKPLLNIAERCFTIFILIYHCVNSSCITCKSSKRSISTTSVVAAIIIWRKKIGNVQYQIMKFWYPKTKT